MNAKPRFDPAGGGWREDVATTLPEEVCRELTLHALKGLSKPDAEKMVQSAARCAQDMLMGRRGESFRDTRDQLLRVADAARELQKAMRMLGPTAIADVEAHEKSAKSGSENSPVQWPEIAMETVRQHWPKDGVLSCSWDLVDALEQTTRYAAGYLPQGKGTQSPDVNAAVGLAYLVALAHQAHFDALPPKDRAGWFVDFMQALGNACGLDCGPRPVAAAVEQLTPTHR